MTIRIDAIEAITGAAFGLLIAITANNLVLPVWGFVPSIGQSFQMGLIFFGLSLVQRYAFRRLFRWWSL